MNPLLLPPRLLLRAPDDLHQIALSASTVERLGRLVDRLPGGFRGGTACTTRGAGGTRGP